MTYVIIGGGGYLGAHVIQALQKNGCQERITVVDPNPVVFKTISYNQELVTIVKSSFLDEQLLENVLRGAKVVIHLAAIGHTGLIAKNRDAVYNFNVTGTKMLVEASKKHGVSRFLYASSVAVSFVGLPLTYATEDDPLPDPEKYLDHYSATKAEAETFVLSQSTPEFKTVALRFRGIYGPEDPNVTHKVASLIRKGLFVGMVSVHGRESKSMASSVKNCAKAFTLADEMLKKPDGIHGRSYYIMDEDTVGQYEFWTPLVLALGRKPPSRFISYDLMNWIVPHSENLCYGFLKVPPMLTKFELLILATDNTFSIERARRELGYEPDASLMEDVAAYYRDLENLPEESSFTWPFAIGVVVLAVILFFLYPLY